MRAREAKFRSRMEEFILGVATRGAESWVRQHRWVTSACDLSATNDYPTPLKPPSTTWWLKR
jgi:hypothetical protein